MRTAVLAKASALALVAGFASAKEVHVSSFGFDPEDSTRFIEAAIDSGADRVVFDKMPSPWMTCPLRGAAHQELFFEPGAELSAKQGAFLDKNDVLITWGDADDVAVVGRGATIRMSKADYQKPPYQKSEWRHALSFLSCRRVCVEGVSIRDSGGDGIYIGHKRGSRRRRCEDVVIRDVVCEGNHRQGLSVISVRGLLVERCRFNGTRGTPPAAGIDFEPNGRLDSLSGIVVRDCELNDNQGDGIDLSLHQLRSSSAPVDILIENCRLSGNYRGFAFSQMFDALNCAGGRATLRNCAFANSQYSGIDFYQKIPGSVAVKFENCRVENNCKSAPDFPDVFFSSRKRTSPPPANVDFGRLSVVSPISRAPIGFMYEGWSTQAVESVTGALLYTSPAGFMEVALDEKWCMDFSPVRRAEPVHKTLDFRSAQVVDENLGEMMKLSELCLRGRIKYVFYAAGTVDCRFKGSALRLGKRDRPLVVKADVVPVGGGKTRSCEFPSDAAEFAVAVPAAGFYEMSIDAGRSAFALTEASVPVGVLLADDNPQNVIFKPGEFYFYVTEGSDFGLYASGSPMNERVDVELRNPKGEAAWSAENKIFPSTHRVESACGGLWRVKTSKPTRGVLEDYYVDLVGVQPVLFLSARRYWREMMNNNNEKKKK